MLNKKTGDKNINDKQAIPPQIDQQFLTPAYQQDSSQDTLNSPTGIIELDVLLGGGFPRGDVVLLAGSSGSGKTTFSFQWLFEGIKNNENGIYITLTEPLFKSLKNIESTTFYDRSAVEQERLKIIDIREIYEKEKFNPEKILYFIEKNVKETNAKRLCIDSITAIAYNIGDKAKVRKFIFELGKMLATLGCTTILTSEITDKKKVSVYEVEEFISDAILRLDQVKVRGELQRRIQIIKVRGRGYRAEDLYFKISENGIIVFPKLVTSLEYSSPTEKISTGNLALDKMMFGGVYKGSSTLVAGSTGTGKTILSTQFIMEGLKKGEPCLFAGFEESRDQIMRNAQGFGYNLKEYEEKGLLVFRCIYPSEKLLEEHLANIKDIVESKKIKRCVVDSLSSISNTFPRNSFVSFAKRLNGYLKTQNVTSFLTAATSSLIGATTLTESHLSTIIDNIIMLRYVEIQGELRLVLNIIKIRGSEHSKSLRKYDITNKGIVIGHSLSGYEGVMTGVTRKVSETIDEKLESEFKKFIGPMGSSVFSEIKNKGLEKSDVLSYIDELINQGILKKETAIAFKQSIEAVMSSSEREENETVKAEMNENNIVNLENTVSIPEKQNLIEEDRSERKGLWKKLFGGV